jgi:hypothetical protein
VARDRSLSVKYLRWLKSSLVDQRFDAIVQVLELVRSHVFPYGRDDGLCGAYHLLKQLPHRQRLPWCPVVGNSEFDYHDRSLGGGPDSPGQTRHFPAYGVQCPPCGFRSSPLLGQPGRVRSVLPIGAGSCRTKISVRGGACAIAAGDAPLGAPLTVIFARRQNARRGEDGLRAAGGPSPWLAGARLVGLEPADLAAGGTRDGGDQLAVLVHDAQGGVAELDGDGLPAVAEADLDALAGDLDAAAAGDPPLNG